MAADVAARDRLVSAIEEAEAAVGGIESTYDDTDLEGILAIYGMLADLLNIIKDAQSVVGGSAICVADRFTTYDVPGGGIFKIAGGKERKRYDQDALISAAAAAITAHHEVEGVIVHGEAVPAAAVIEAIVKDTATLAGATAPSFANWRSGAAKGLGINLNHYAELEDAPLSHRIEGRSRA